jgi:hypothetical protein
MSHTKHVNKLGKNADLFNVKAGGTYSNHCCFKRWIRTPDNFVLVSFILPRHETSFTCWFWRPIGFTAEQSTEIHMQHLHLDEVYIQFVTELPKSTRHKRVKNEIKYNILRWNKRNTYLQHIPLAWTMPGTGAFSSGVMQLMREVDHPPPTTAEVKKIWIFTSTTIYVHDVVLN